MAFVTAGMMGGANNFNGIFGRAISGAIGGAMYGAMRGSMRTSKNPFLRRAFAQAATKRQQRIQAAIDSFRPNMLFSRFGGNVAMDGLTRAENRRRAQSAYQFQRPTSAWDRQSGNTNSYTLDQNQAAATSTGFGAPNAVTQPMLQAGAQPLATPASSSPLSAASMAETAPQAIPTANSNQLTPTPISPTAMSNQATIQAVSGTQSSTPATAAVDPTTLPVDPNATTSV